MFCTFSSPESFINYVKANLREGTFEMARAMEAECEQTLPIDPSMSIEEVVYELEDWREGTAIDILYHSDNDEDPIKVAQLVDHFDRIERYIKHYEAEWEKEDRFPSYE